MRYGVAAFGVAALAVALLLLLRRRHPTGRTGRAGRAGRTHDERRSRGPRGGGFRVLAGGEFLSADAAVAASSNYSSNYSYSSSCRTNPHREEAQRHDLHRPPPPLPVVYRDVDTLWPAQRRWTPALLSQKVRFLSDVVSLQDGPRFWYEEKAKELDLRANLSATTAQRHVARMETRKFFGPDCDDERHFLWHSSGLEAEPDGDTTAAAAAAVNDIQPVGPFVVHDINIEPIGEDGEDGGGSPPPPRSSGGRTGLTSANAWFGCGAGITTRLHYDMSHNVFVQIYGRKRFTLVPACSQPQHPFTSRRYLHPSNASTIERMMNNGDVAVVVLHPGDVLYLPPLMYHQVESLDPRSISVNVWSFSTTGSLLDKALYGIALPFEDQDPRWGADAVYRAAKAFEYLEHVLPLRAWHASRWASFGESTAKWQSGLLALKLTTQREGKTAHGVRRREKYAARARRVREVFAGVSTRHARILLWNFADSVITYSLGELEQTGDAIASWVALM